MSRVRLAVVLALAAGLSPETSLAAPKRPSGEAARASAPRARAASPKPARAARKAAAPKPAAPKPAAGQPGEPASGGAPGRTPPGGASEVKVAPAAPTPQAGVVKTEEAEKGVKTYTFGAEEVEGRLRSPQILYFLRRVRAEFDAEPLGHRSFLLELADTRRDPSLE